MSGVNGHHYPGPPAARYPEVISQSEASVEVTPANQGRVLGGGSGQLWGCHLMWLVLKSCDNYLMAPELQARINKKQGSIKSSSVIRVFSACILMIEETTVATICHLGSQEFLVHGLNFIQSSFGF